MASPPPPPPPSSARPRVLKRCTVAGCESFARSRGCCKAHGGGKRCCAAGCELSDQGGGYCIRHGGGKRCEVPGCTKSAQSRRFCKAHGGGVRCRVEGCSKTSQGGGCCRSHGGGPRSSNKQPQQLRSSRASALAPRAGPAFGMRARPRVAGARTKTGAAAVKVEQPVSPAPTCMLDTPPHNKPGSLRPGSAKTFPFDARRTKASAFDQPLRSRESSRAVREDCGCDVDGCDHVASLGSGQHDANILTAASLLGMLAARPA